MLSFPIEIRPSDAVKEIKDVNEKLSKGIENLSTLKDEDVDIGSTPKDVIYSQDRLRVYHYKPLVDKAKILKTPLLIVPPLINGYEVADLQPDRSLVRNLLNEGLDVHLIDWGYPLPIDKYLTIDDYINGYLNDVVDFLRQYHSVDKLSVLGICQGGTISTTYSSLYPDKIKHLVLTVTPIDFSFEHDPKQAHIGLLFHLAREVNVDLMVNALGNVPADLLNVSFMMASPFVLNIGKYADLVDILDDKKALLNFLRMEKWLFGGPSAAGETYRQFVKNYLQENKLVKGELVIGGKEVNLKNVTMPVLNIYAQKDHLVPPPCTVALKKYVGSKDYTELEIQTGHIGIYTGGASQKILAPNVGKWLRERAN
ncbi:MAG: class III poly(R)-hydroxyalkanoic acid synthase subunit PhaC [Candidatus Competibacteraceae bacterium]